MPVVDIHAHCIPPAFRAWLEGGGPGREVEVASGPGGARIRFGERFTTGPMRDSLGDMGQRLTAMDRMGIGVQLLAGWVDLTGYDLPPDVGVGYSRAHNDMMAEEASAHPDRFRALATVPLQDPPGAARELERAMADLGMVGAQIATTVGPLWLDEAGLAPFWEVAEGLGALIVLHPMAPLTGVPLDRYFMDNLVGRPAETTIALAGLILSGVLERHPGLTLCAVHGGGFLPYQIGRLDRGYRVRPDWVGVRLDQSPGESLSRVYVDTVVHHPGVLGFLVESLGADRILLGSDFPFEMGDDDPVGLVGSVVGLDPGQREAIISGNVMRILEAQR